ncbi:CP2 transcription factor-domain-containing protein [Fennellomyces sp. T-0311]|nr:CP2 transcription factor-domain-containing protein [Fennellomyces sp. T-0311]
MPNGRSRQPTFNRFDSGLPATHPSPTATLSPISFLSNSGNYPARATSNAPGVPYPIDTATIHQPVFSPSPYSSQPSSFLSGGMAPSPPTSCPSPASLRYDIILEAPPAAAQRSEEAQLTYLNKGQYYCITLNDSDGYDGFHTSTLAIMFHDESHRRLALNYWRFWLGQQREPETARALEINTGRCSNIHNLQCEYFDRVTFNWHGKRNAKIYVRFNCLSTDFSRIKGVKGIPLRLHMETQGSSVSDPVHQQMPSPLVEATYCRIKLFRDKGAERKNKDDQRHIEKQIEKLQGNPGEMHPLLSALRREIKYTAFSDIAEELSPPVVSSVALEYSNNANTAERFKSSKTTLGLSTSSASISPVSTSPASPRGVKRPNQDYFGQQSTTVRTYNSSSSSSPTYQSQHTLYDNNSPLIVDGVDPNYIPVRRRRHAVLSLFARSPTDEYYRAIYLDELTVQNLIKKISSKLNLPVPVKNVVRHVSKVETEYMDSNNTIAVRVDDAMVHDIPEQQDMEIEIKLDDDGLATLVLRY